MAYRFLSVRTEDRVGWLEFNRPPINAFHREMVEEVGAAQKLFRAMTPGNPGIAG